MDAAMLARLFHGGGQGPFLRRPSMEPFPISPVAPPVPPQAPAASPLQDQIVMEVLRAMLHNASE